MLQFVTSKSTASAAVALIALASGLEIGVVLLTLDEDLVNRYGHSH